MSFSQLPEQYLIMNRDYKQGLYEPTLNGTHNEGMEEKNGYCQAVSGLTEMSMTHERMLNAEGKYWNKFKQANPDLWKAQVQRFKQTRGTIFTERLLKCIKWLNSRRIKMTL